MADDQQSPTPEEIRALVAATAIFLAEEVRRHQERVTAAIHALQDQLRSEVYRLKVRETDTHLLGPKVNLPIAQKIHARMGREVEKTYGAATRGVVSDFSRLSERVVDDYRALGVGVSVSKVDRVTAQTLKTHVYQQFARLGSVAQDRIADAMYTHVVAGGTWAELETAVIGILSGHKDVRGRPLTAYSRQFAWDATMDFYQAINLQHAEEAGLDHFLYVGDIIATSRDFCIARVEKIYSKSQIESWNTMSWDGKSGPPLQHRGGYNCRHHWQPVDPSWFPESARGGEESAVLSNKTVAAPT